MNLTGHLLSNLLGEYLLLEEQLQLHHVNMFSVGNALLHQWKLFFLSYLFHVFLSIPSPFMFYRLDVKHYGAFCL